MLIDNTFNNIELMVKAAAAAGRLGPGRNFFVGNGTAQHQQKGASDANSGTPVDPFATIDYAVGRCTANRHDNIIVLQGHAENVTAAAGIDLDVAGITLLGLGSGTLTPTITFTTATTADIDIDAANVTIDNFRFAQTFDALAAPIDVNAAWFTMRNCRSVVANATTQATRWILTDAAATGMRLLDSEFLGVRTVGATAGEVSIITLTGGSDILIQGCNIQGRCTTTIGPVQVLTTEVLGLTIRDCYIANWTTASTTCVLPVSPSEVVIRDNTFVITDNLTLAPVTLAGGLIQFAGRNFVINDTDETGAIVGAVSA